jgi:hypothetical protein
MMSLSRGGYHPGGVSLPISDTTDEMPARLVDAMRGRVVDGIRIHDARASVDEYPAYESTVRLLLGGPRLASR